MDPIADFEFFCPIPPERISDVVPMLVVMSVFLLSGWLIRRWRKKRKKNKSEQE